MGATTLIELLSARGEDFRALDSRVGERTRAVRLEASQRTVALRASLDRACRQNYHTEDEWRDLTARLQRAVDPERRDLAGALIELEAMARDLEQSRPPHASASRTTWRSAAVMERKGVLGRDGLESVLTLWATRPSQAPVWGRWAIT